MNYVDRKYQEFYEKHGYIPKMFHPYNCNEKLRFYEVNYVM